VGKGQAEASPYRFRTMPISVKSSVQDKNAWLMPKLAQTTPARNKQRLVAQQE
jgi:hypothetical protein